MDVTPFIDKVLDHHKKHEYNSIHSKFGFLIAGKLNTKYDTVLKELSQKPILGEDSLNQDVRNGEVLEFFYKVTLALSLQF